jgi:hypothetical protein
MFKFPSRNSLARKLVRLGAKWEELAAFPGAKGKELKWSTSHRKRNRQESLIKDKAQVINPSII